jgi:hypothetical protein
LTVIFPGKTSAPIGRTGAESKHRKRARCGRKTLAALSCERAGSPHMTTPGAVRATHGPHETSAKGSEQSVTVDSQAAAQLTVGQVGAGAVPPIFQAGHAGSIPVARSKKPQVKAASSPRAKGWAQGCSVDYGLPPSRFMSRSRVMPWCASFAATRETRSGSSTSSSNRAISPAVQPTRCRTSSTCARLTTGSRSSAGRPRFVPTIATFPRLPSARQPAR